MTRLPNRLPFSDYIAPAKARSGWWRLPLGLGLVLAGWIVWTALVLTAYVAFLRVGGATVDNALAKLDSLLAGAGPGSVALMLATFAGIWPMLWLVLRSLHAQHLATLFAPEGRPRWLDFAIGLWLGAMFYAGSLTIAIAIAGLPAPTALGGGLWGLWLLPIAGLVLVQAGAEETVFRGYILSQIAIRAPNPLVWAVLPALLFGILHFDGSLPGVSGLLYVVATFLFALTAATLVWRTGSLSAAIGLHVAVNICGLTLAGVDGVISGAQLWQFPRDQAEGLLVGDTVATAVLLAFAMSRFCPLGPPLAKEA